MCSTQIDDESLIALVERYGAANKVPPTIKAKIWLKVEYEYNKTHPKHQSTKKILIARWKNVKQREGRKDVARTKEFKKTGGSLMAADLMLDDLEQKALALSYSSKKIPCDFDSDAPPGSEKCASVVVENIGKYAPVVVDDPNSQSLLSTTITATPSAAFQPHFTSAVAVNPITSGGSVIDLAKLQVPAYTEGNGDKLVRNKESDI